VIGVMRVIAAAQSHTIGANPVRVIEFIRLYSNQQTLLKSDLDFFIGSGYEYFLDRGQAFFKLGGSISCTHPKGLKNKDSGMVKAL